MSKSTIPLSVLSDGAPVESNIVGEMEGGSVGGWIVKGASVRTAVSFKGGTSCTTSGDVEGIETGAEDSTAIGVDVGVSLLDSTVGRADESATETGGWSEESNAFVGNSVESSSTDGDKEGSSDRVGSGVVGPNAGSLVTFCGSGESVALPFAKFTPASTSHSSVGS
jgi:hypothetical protein